LIPHLEQNSDGAELADPQFLQIIEVTVGKFPFFLPVLAPKRLPYSTPITQVTSIKFNFNILLVGMLLKNNLGSIKERI
jgi:hypothetical protein